MLRNARRIIARDELRSTAGESRSAALGQLVVGLFSESDNELSVLGASAICNGVAGVTMIIIVLVRIRTHCRTNWPQQQQQQPIGAPPSISEIRGLGGAGNSTRMSARNNRERGDGQIKRNDGARHVAERAVRRNNAFLLAHGLPVVNK